LVGEDRSGVDVALVDVEQRQRDPERLQVFRRHLAIDVGRGHAGELFGREDAAAHDTDLADEYTLARQGLELSPRRRRKRGKNRRGWSRPWLLPQERRRLARPPGGFAEGRRLGMDCPGQARCQDESDREPNPLHHLEHAGASTDRENRGNVSQRWPSLLDSSDGSALKSSATSGLGRYPPGSRGRPSRPATTRLLALPAASRAAQEARRSVPACNSTSGRRATLPLRSVIDA